jgi:hypothetical protein
VVPEVILLLIQPKYVLNLSPAPISRKLCKYDPNGNAQELQTTVEFTIVSIAGPVSAAQMQMDEAVAQGNATIDRMKLIPLSLEHTEGVADDSIIAVGRTEAIVVTWGPFLQKVELLTGIVDKIAEVRHANYR